MIFDTQTDQVVGVISAQSRSLTTPWVSRRVTHAPHKAVTTVLPIGSHQSPGRAQSINQPFRGDISERVYRLPPPRLYPSV